MGLDLPAPMGPGGQSARRREGDLHERGAPRPRLRPHAGLGHAGAPGADPEERRARGPQRGRPPRWEGPRPAPGVPPLDALIRHATLAEPAGARPPLRGRRRFARGVGTHRRQGDPGLRRPAPAGKPPWRTRKRRWISVKAPG